MYNPTCLRMTSDECKKLHKLEDRRRKAINATADELQRLIGARVADYDAADACAQALMDVLLSYDGETAIAAATSYLAGCGYTITKTTENG